MTDIEKILETARSQIGYVEEPNGWNKYNKAYYGYDCDYAWCVVFVWWVFSQSGLPNLFYGGKKTASCGTLFNFYKQWGQVVTSKIPQPGDLVEFTFNGVQHCHIGICESFDGNNVTTIDGNTSDTSASDGGKVLRRTRSKSCIYGVIRPTYASGSIKPQTTTEQSAVIWKFLMGKIGNAFGVAGLMGNVEAESAFIPNNLQNACNKKWGIDDYQYTKEVDDGVRSFLGGGYGICQWTSNGRKSGLYDLAKAENASVGNIDAQLDWLWKELTTSYKGVLKVLQNATTVKEASDKVLTGFERPKDQSEANKQRRAERGEKIYERFAGGEIWYTVQKGDSLYKIGKKFNVPWQNIAKLNGIEAPYTIYPNQRLRIK